MRAFIFRPSRLRDGKRLRRRIYWGEYRLPGDATPTRVSLATSDERVAEKRLRELIERLEHERAGIALPAPLVAAASKPLADHLADRIKDLKASGKTREYYRHVESRVTRLIADCGWKLPCDVTADSFVAWRNEQKMSARSLNHHLDAIRSLLAWMLAQGRIATNVLASIKRADARGRAASRRRALTTEECRRLIAHAPMQRKVVYLAALTTGLRRGELGQLQWEHVNLASGVILIPASIAKSRREESQPLNSETADLLWEWWNLCGNPANGRVFRFGMPSHHTFEADREVAGIAKKDAVGRKVDFHALRYTFATNLYRSGASQREAQGLMRHTDPKLTSVVYTDERALGLSDAAERLPRLIGGAYLDAGVLVPEGHSVSRAGNPSAAESTPQTPANNGDRRAQARHVPICHRRAKKWSRGDSNPRAETVSRARLQRVADLLISA